MIAICPAGPPKLIKPSFSQYQKASFSVGAGGVLGLFESINFFSQAKKYWHEKCFIIINSNLLG
jgi:hypothetical protein